MALGSASVQVASLCRAVHGWVMVSRSPEAAMATTTLLPFRPDAMTPAQLAVVSYLARYIGHTHTNGQRAMQCAVRWSGDAAGTP